MTSLVCHMTVLWSLLTPSVPHDVIHVHVHDLVYPNQNPTRDLNLLIIIVIIIITIMVGNHIIHDLVLILLLIHDHLYHLHIIVIHDPWKEELEVQIITIINDHNQD